LFLFFPHLLPELLVQRKIFESNVRMLAQYHTQLVLEWLIVRHEEIGVPIGVALPQQR